MLKCTSCGSMYYIAFDVVLKKCTAVYNLCIYYIFACNMYLPYWYCTEMLLSFRSSSVLWSQSFEFSGLRKQKAHVSRHFCCISLRLPAIKRVFLLLLFHIIQSIQQNCCAFNECAYFSEFTCWSMIPRCATLTIPQSYVYLILHYSVQRVGTSRQFHWECCTFLSFAWGK